MIAGDGQVSFGNTVIKSNARKVRRLGTDGQVIAGFAGATADAFTLFERLEGKLEAHPGQLVRACVELAKDWRTDRYLRRLEAMMAVADKENSLVLTGNGDVLEPEDGLIGIGSGGAFALAAARALIAAMGLLGHVAAFGRGFALRSGADLVPTRTTAAWVEPGERAPVELPTVAEAQALVAAARERAAAVGVPLDGWGREPIVLTPHENLTKAIRATWPSADED